MTSTTPIKPFIFSTMYVTVACPAPGYEMFEIEARLSLTGSERDALKRDLDAIEADAQAVLDRYGDEGRALDDEQRTIAKDDAAAIDDWKQRSVALIEQQGHDVDAVLLRRAEIVAPFIRAWNAHIETGGDPEPIAPPAVAGAVAFDALDDTMTAFCLSLLSRYRSGRGLSGLGVKRPIAPALTLVA